MEVQHRGCATVRRPSALLRGAGIAAVSDKRNPAHASLRSPRDSSPWKHGAGSCPSKLLRRRGGLPGSVACLASPSPSAGGAARNGFPGDWTQAGQGTCGVWHQSMSHAPTCMLAMCVITCMPARVHGRRTGHADAAGLCAVAGRQHIGHWRRGMDADAEVADRPLTSSTSHRTHIHACTPPAARTHAAKGGPSGCPAPLPLPSLSHPTHAPTHLQLGNTRPLLRLC